LGRVLGVVEGAQEEGKWGVLTGAGLRACLLRASAVISVAKEVKGALRKSKPVVGKEDSRRLGKFVDEFMVAAAQVLPARTLRWERVEDEEEDE
jgi:hypothetical protein